jgi:hypothetical protein
LVGKDIGYQPLGKIVHRDHEVSFPSSLHEKGPATLMAILSNRDPDIVLMHLAPIHGPGAATDYTGIALPPPPLNIVSCLEPVVSLLELSFTLLRERITWLLSSYVGGFLMVVQYAVPHSEGFPLDPVSLVREAAFNDVFPFWARYAKSVHSRHCLVCTSSRTGPMSWSFSFPFSEWLDPSRLQLRPQ